MFDIFRFIYLLSCSIHLIACFRVTIFVLALWCLSFMHKELDEADLFTDLDLLEDYTGYEWITIPDARILVKMVLISTIFLPLSSSASINQLMVFLDLLLLPVNSIDSTILSDKEARFWLGLSLNLTYKYSNSPANVKLAFKGLLDLINDLTFMPKFFWEQFELFIWYFDFGLWQNCSKD